MIISKKTSIIAITSLFLLFVVLLTVSRTLVYSLSAANLDVFWGAIDAAGMESTHNLNRDLHSKDPRFRFAVVYADSRTNLIFGSLQRTKSSTDIPDDLMGALVVVRDQKPVRVLQTDSSWIPEFSPRVWSFDGYDLMFCTFQADLLTQLKGGKSTMDWSLVFRIHALSETGDVVEVFRHDGFGIRFEGDRKLLYQSIAITESPGAGLIITKLSQQFAAEVVKDGDRYTVVTQPKVTGASIIARWDVASSRFVMEGDDTGTQLLPGDPAGRK